MVGAALKGARPEQGNNLDCGSSYAAWGNGLTAWFAKDRFVGWSARAGTAPLTTASGIGVGASRAALESVYSARIASSTLGLEFSAGGLAGLLDGDGPSATVSALWAGATCIAR